MIASLRACFIVFLLIVCGIMPEYGSLVNFLNCSWKTAVSAFWVKYPNQYSQHVLSEDVLDRKLISNGQLYTRRLLTKTNHLPSWGHIVFKSHMKNTVDIIEESIIDPSRQLMTIYTWNTTYKHMMDVQEKMTITPSSGDRTEVLREGWVDSSLIGVRRVLRKFGSSRWKSNAKKAFLGFEETIKQNSGCSNVETNLTSISNAKDKAKLKAINLAARRQVHS